MDFVSAKIAYFMILFYIHMKFCGKMEEKDGW